MKISVLCPGLITYELILVVMYYLRAIWQVSFFSFFFKCDFLYVFLHRLRAYQSQLV